MLSNIGSLISIKPDNHNYLLWKSQFLAVLRAYGLIGFIDGTISPPPKFLIDDEGNISKKIYPLFTTWFQ